MGADLRHGCCRDGAGAPADRWRCAVYSTRNATLRAKRWRAPVPPLYSVAGACLVTSICLSDFLFSERERERERETGKEETGKEETETETEGGGRQRQGESVCCGPLTQTLVFRWICFGQQFWCPYNTTHGLPHSHILPIPQPPNPVDEEPGVG